MMKLTAGTALAVLSAGLAACSNYEKNEAAYNEANAAYSETGSEGGNYTGTQTASTTWPAGSRIVVENGVTYRIEPGGTRVELGPNDSRILVEDGVRYRVDPGGARVRIDPSGAEIVTNVSGTSVNVSTNMP